MRCPGACALGLHFLRGGDVDGPSGDVVEHTLHANREDKEPPKIFGVNQRARQAVDKYGCQTGCDAVARPHYTITVLGGKFPGPPYDPP